MARGAPSMSVDNRLELLILGHFITERADTRLIGLAAVRYGVPFLFAPPCRWKGKSNVKKVYRLGALGKGMVH